MRPPFRRLSADDRLAGEEDRARGQRLHAGRVSSIVAALGLTRFLPFIHGATPVDVAALPAKLRRAGRHGRRRPPRRSFALKAAAAISFVMVVSLGTTAASLPLARTPNSSATPAVAVTTTTPAPAVTTTTTPPAAVTTTTTTPPAAVTTTTTTPAAVDTTTTSPSAGTTTTTAPPADSAATTAAAAAAPLADDPTIIVHIGGVRAGNTT